MTIQRSELVQAHPRASQGTMPPPSRHDRAHSAPLEVATDQRGIEIGCSIDARGLATGRLGTSSTPSNAIDSTSKFDSWSCLPPEGFASPRSLDNDDRRDSLWTIFLAVPHGFFALTSTAGRGFHRLHERKALPFPKVRHVNGLTDGLATAVLHQPRIPYKYGLWR